MKVSVDGGAPVKIAAGFFTQIAQSVDGKLLAFLNAPEVKGGKYNFQIMFVSTDGSNPPEPIDADPRFGREDRPFAGLLRFMPDGKGYAYGILEDSVSNIWVQPLLLSQQIVSQTQSPPQLSANPTAAKNTVNVSSADNGSYQPGLGPPKHFSARESHE